MKQVSIVFEVPDDKKYLDFSRKVEDFIRDELGLKVIGLHAKNLDEKWKK